MNRNLLFDASSLIYALKLRNLKLLYNNFIQWLTIYEVTNALWKEATIFNNISIQDAQKLIEILKESTSLMKILTPHPYEAEILMTAKKLNLTAYDASYIVLAKRNNLQLITEDKKLKRKAGKFIKAASINELI